MSSLGSYSEKVALMYEYSNYQLAVGSMLQVCWNLLEILSLAGVTETAHRNRSKFGAWHAIKPYTKQLVKVLSIYCLQEELIYVAKKRLCQWLFLFTSPGYTDVFRIAARVSVLQGILMNKTCLSWKIQLIIIIFLMSRDSSSSKHPPLHGR